jgi:protein-disulfide isomerase
MRDMRYGRSRGLRSLIIGILGASLCASLAAAQQTAQAAGDDITALKKDVQQLKTQQQQILDRLDELKKLLSGRVGAASTAPTIKAPDVMSVQGEPFRGEASSLVAIIEYGDFECPFCRHFQHDIYPQVLDDYIKAGKVKYFYRDMPLPFHQHALPAARAARCAGEQGKYWEMYDSLFADKLASTSAEIDDQAKGLGLDTAKLDACVNSDRFADAIHRNVDEASKMQIRGTPTFLIGTMSPGSDLVNIKTTVIGAQPFEAFKAAIDPLLSPAPPAIATSGAMVHPPVN